MNTEKLERSNILAKSLIPKVNELLNMSPKSMRSSYNIRLDCIRRYICLSVSNSR